MKSQSSGPFNRSRPAYHHGAFVASRSGDRLPQSASIHASRVRSGADQRQWGESSPVRQQGQPFEGRRALGEIVPRAAGGSFEPSEKKTCGVGGSPGADRHQGGTPHPGVRIIQTRFQYLRRIGVAAESERLHGSGSDMGARVPYRSPEDIGRPGTCQRTERQCRALPEPGGKIAVEDSFEQARGPPVTGHACSLDDGLGVRIPV